MIFKKDRLIDNAMLSRSLEDVIDSLKDIPLAFKDVKAVIVFGSAARPKDFVPSVSDIDVLVVTSSVPESRRRHSMIDSRVELIFYSLDEVLEMAERGDPLIFMLKYSKVIYDEARLMPTLKPKITDRTLKILRRSIFAALGLAFQEYFYQDYTRAVHYTYHSLRHLVRYEVALSMDPSRFPVSDEEILEASPEDMRDLIARAIEVRRRDAEKQEAREILRESMSHIASELGLKSPNAEDILGRFPSENLTYANVCEEGGIVAVKVILRREKENLILRITKEGMSEANTVFCEQ